ncbi:MAG: AAA family ATPase [Deltaproteobacteria bacterium]|nr:AAA family ATPase [Deltaproteobacteria bacterium]
MIDINDFIKKFELKPEDIIIRTKIERLFEESEKFTGIMPGIIGQERAIDSIKLGISIDSPGYNIFVCGVSGSGRTSTVKDLLKSVKKPRKKLLDRCYVYNFKNPDAPSLIELPVGMGNKFKKEIDNFVNSLKDKIPKLFYKPEYARESRKLRTKAEKKQASRVEEFSRRLRKDGFVLTEFSTPAGSIPQIAFLQGKKPVDMNTLAKYVDAGKLKEEEFRVLLDKHKKKEAELDEVYKEMRRISKDFEEQSRNLDRSIVEKDIDGYIEEISNRYNNEKISEFLNGIKADLLDNISVFKDEVITGMPEEESEERMQKINELLSKYKVNLILDNSGSEECPVVHETMPTFGRLFGTIDVSQDQNMKTPANHMSIKGGSLLKADGGFLILNAHDIVQEPLIWRMLKRTLKNRKLEIQNIEGPINVNPTSLKPEPINIDVKTIIIGDEDLYQFLCEFDPDFKKIFKIKAEFDLEMELNAENVSKYRNFILRTIKEENLKKIDKEAIIEVIKYAISKVSDINKLTTLFSDIADLLREASFISELNKNSEIKATDVVGAIRRREHRHSLIKDNLEKAIEEDVIIIETDGYRIGTINGLIIYELPDTTFGKPSRITATVSVGREGIINIERQSFLAGPIFNKATLIINGYLQEQFGYDIPLSVNASICFEQSYSDIEGDSASIAEIYAILSALSEVPIYQGIAVTGSMTQKGEVQPVGGINEKIEGFYELVKRRGFNGKQGVIIPRKNLRHLVLKDEIIESVSKGEFHIYGIDRVEEGIPILMGMESGVRIGSEYSPNSVFSKIREKLRFFSQIMREYK